MVKCFVTAVCQTPRLPASLYFELYPDRGFPRCGPQKCPDPCLLPEASLWKFILTLRNFHGNLIIHIALIAVAPAIEVMHGFLSSGRH